MQTLQYRLENTNTKYHTVNYWIKTVLHHSWTLYPKFKKHSGLLLTENSRLLQKLIVTLQSEAKFILTHTWMFNTLHAQDISLLTVLYITFLSCFNINQKNHFSPKHLFLYSLLPSIISATSNLPHKVKTQYVHFRLHTNYFLLPWKIPEEISRWPILFQ